MIRCQYLAFLIDFMKVIIYCCAEIQRISEQSVTAILQLPGGTHFST